MTYPYNSFSLEKLTLPNAHLVGGHEFPVAFKINLDSADTNVQNVDLSEYLKHLAENDVFNTLQEKHGAVVVNLLTTDPNRLSKYIRLIQEASRKHPFPQSGALAKRRDIAPFLQTANEGDPSRRIHQHSEFSRFKTYPNNLVFANVKHSKTTVGGATPIVHCGELYKRLDDEIPQFLTELTRNGLYMTQTWPYAPDESGVTWVDKFSFGADITADDTSLEEKKLKAEKIIRERVSDDFEWLEGSNDVKVHQHSKPVRKYINGAYNVLFSSLPTYYNEMKNNKEGIVSIKYDNGELIPKEYLEKVLDTAIELEYLHDWSEGDVVFIDNRQVSHGRRPWSDGERVVLVSMWDDSRKPVPVTV